MFYRPGCLAQRSHVVHSRRDHFRLISLLRCSVQSLQLAPLAYRSTARREKEKEEMEAQIEEKLRAAFSPTHVTVECTGGDKYQVVLVSDSFSHTPLLARHRAVNAALAAELEGEIHALSLTVKTPAE